MVAPSACSHAEGAGGRTRRATPNVNQLSLIAEGRSNAAIAQALVVTTRALGKHMASIFMKLDLPAENDERHRRVMAVVQCLNS